MSQFEFLPATFVQVMTRSSRWFEDFAEMRNTLRYRVNESVFPPSPDKADKFHLERW